MRRHTHWKHYCPLGTACLGERYAAFDCRTVACNHNLARRIQIDRLQYLVRCCINANGTHLFGVEPEHRGDSADARRHGFLHCLGTQPDQWQRIDETKHACGHESGIFAQTVSSEVRRGMTAFFLPRAERGDSRREHQRLGIDCLILHVGRAVDGHRPKVNMENV